MAYYVHVPFCAAHCWYCDYPVLVGSLDLARPLVDAMLAEATALRAAMRERAVAALYVGGGTPSRLPRPQLRRLLAGLAGALLAGGASGEAPEWTLEANPEDLDEELLQLCGAAGVNRLSVGAQTFEDRLLQRLGRRCDGGTLSARLELLVRRWHGRINIDLLAGVPGQRPASVAGAVDRLAAMGIDHVTLLQLEDPPPGGPLPAADADELWLAGCERLRGHGYRQYEVTHFGRHGDRSRYLRHALLLRPVAGIGPGAAGTLPAAVGAAVYQVAPTAAAGALHVAHAVEIAPYLAAGGRGWGAAVSAPTATELLGELVLQGMRLAEGVEAAPRWFSPPLEDLLAPLWGRWAQRGLALPSDRRLALTARGRLQLDRLAAQAVAHVAAARDAAALTAAWPDGGG